MLTGSAGWFLPLAYGKPAPYIWTIAFWLKVLPPEHYLLAGRLPSVFFGLVTLLGTYKLGAICFGKKVGLGASFLYVISPFALFHDRMTLYDSMLCAFLVWTIYFVIKSGYTHKIKHAALWGIFLGLALLTKASAVSFEVLTPICFLIIGGFKKIWLILIAVLISQIIVNLQIVSHGYLDYLTKATDYTSSGIYFATNLSLTYDWLNHYITGPILLAFFVSLIYLTIKRPRLGAVFVILSIVPLIGFSFVARIYFPRYILFTLPFFLLPLSFLLEKLGNKNKLVFLCVVPFLLFLAIKFDYFLITKPELANFPAIDKWQYVEGFPSGYGFKPIFEKLHEESETKKIHLIVQGSFSHYPNAFFLEFWDNPNVWIEERWPLEKIASQEFIPTNKTKPIRFDKTYFVVRNNYKVNQNNVTQKYNLKPIIVGIKPAGKDNVYLSF